MESFHQPRRFPCNFAEVRETHARDNALILYSWEKGERQIGRLGMGIDSYEKMLEVLVLHDMDPIGMLKAGRLLFD